MHLGFLVSTTEKVFKCTESAAHSAKRDNLPVLQVVMDQMMMMAEGMVLMKAVGGSSCSRRKTYPLSP